MRHVCTRDLFLFHLRHAHTHARADAHTSTGMRTQIDGHTRGAAAMATHYVQ
jgi:hypothetical protein